MTEQKKIEIDSLDERVYLSMERNSPRQPKYIVCISPGKSLGLEEYKSAWHTLSVQRPDLLAPFLSGEFHREELMPHVVELAVWCDSRGLEAAVVRTSSSKMSNSIARVVYSLTGRMV